MEPRNIAVDCEGTVWVACNGHTTWRYIVDPDGSLSWDVFESLPTKYEPYVELDGAAGSLVYHYLKGPREQPFSTEKR